VLLALELVLRAVSVNATSKENEQVLAAAAAQLDDGSSDVEDENGPNQQQQQQQQRARAQRNTPGITAQQLAMAMAGVQGGGLSPVTPATPAPTPQRHMSNLDLSASGAQQRATHTAGIPSSSGTGNVTAEMLQSAMMNVLRQSGAGNATQSAPLDVSANVAQLVMMGFGDPVSNERALRTTNNDLALAIDMLIAERSQMDLD